MNRVRCRYHMHPVGCKVTQGLGLDRIGRCDRRVPGVRNLSVRCGRNNGSPALSSVRGEFVIHVERIQDHTTVIQTWNGNSVMAIVLHAYFLLEPL